MVFREGVRLLEDLLVVVICSGGYNREACLRTVECYDPLARTWSFLAPMRMPRARFQMAVLMVCRLLLGFSWLAQKLMG